LNCKEEAKLACWWCMGNIVPTLGINKIQSKKV